MRLVKAGSWAREYFAAGSRPKRDTVIIWIREGAVPGRIIGGYPYVDVEAFELLPVEAEAPARPDAELDLLG